MRKVILTAAIAALTTFAVGCERTHDEALEGGTGGSGQQTGPTEGAAQGYQDPGGMDPTGSWGEDRQQESDAPGSATGGAGTQGGAVQPPAGSGEPVQEQPGTQGSPQRGIGAQEPDVQQPPPVDGEQGDAPAGAVDRE